MYHFTDQIDRRSFLTRTAGAGAAIIPGQAGVSTGAEQRIEIVSTEEAQLYYEFAVRGEVEGIEVSDENQGRYERRHRISH